MFNIVEPNNLKQDKQQPPDIPGDHARGRFLFPPQIGTLRLHIIAFNVGIGCEIQKISVRL